MKVAKLKRALAISHPYPKNYNNKILEQNLLFIIKLPCITSLLFGYKCCLEQMSLEQMSLKQMSLKQMSFEQI